MECSIRRMKPDSLLVMRLRIGLVHMNSSKSIVVRDLTHHLHNAYNATRYYLIKIKPQNLEALICFRRR